MSSIPAERYDLVIQKKAKFYQEFQQVQDDMRPISLVGKTLKCTVKESFSSSIIIHELTEANQGMVKVDAANGVFGMFIPANQTDVPYDYAVYDIIIQDNMYPTTETERVVEGKITYTKGVTA